MISKEYEKYIAISRYAKWLEEENRRETWEETVKRYCDNLVYPKFKENGISTIDGTYDDIVRSITELDTLGSMRALMTAGAALDRDHVAGYNCAYTHVTGRGKELEIWNKDLEDAGLEEPIKINLHHPIVFDEIMYILLCGTGVGFSVERQWIANLPTVGKRLSRAVYARKDSNYKGVPEDELSTFSRKTNTIYVADSKYGWASALRILIVELYNGNAAIQWDMSKVRPAGEPLKTFGGRSSGPEPLNDLFIFVTNTITTATNRKLTSVECHDIICKIASVVVVGGVRRSACISLSNLTDERMRTAKTGSWWTIDPHRALSNNSVCYTEKPDMGIFLREWESLYGSRSGERGIFSREACRKITGRNGRRDTNYEFGTNPCSEIILRDRQFCNLSEVVVRPKDTLDDLKRKVRLATILGTLQATLTDFKYLSDGWRENTEEEALLGVSLTGIMDHPVLSNAEHGCCEFREDFQKPLSRVLEELKEVAIETNKEWAEKLGINPATAITCVKPSGTVSQLVNSASGIHPRFSSFYIRRAALDKKDPLGQLLVDQGVIYEEDESKYYFMFPIKAPEGATVVKDIGAMQQLELIDIYNKHWCEHKVSCTVYYTDDEFLEVGNWIYKNFDEVSGISFFPHSDHVYKHAPYEEITEEEYNQMVEESPKRIEWERLPEYEVRDTTSSSQELACAGGACEI